jgi:DNA-binding IclR family transcriptional regulator
MVFCPPVGHGRHNGKKEVFGGVFRIMEQGSNHRGSPPIPGTQALSRAINILQAFTDEQPDWTLSALCAELDLRKPTAHRILSALAQRGFLSRMSGRAEYRLGPEVIVLGARALRAADFREMAQPELRYLAETTGETATLESLVDGGVLILQEERGRGLLSAGTEIGTRWPVHATATGKVLMAFSEPGFSKPVDGLPAITGHTIVSPGKWHQALSEVRAKGYATNIEELEYGYSSVAAPVHDRAGHTIASMSVGGPVQRMTKDRIPELATILTASARRVSERLGYRSQDA